MGFRLEKPFCRATTIDTFEAVFRIVRHRIVTATLKVPLLHLLHSNASWGSSDAPVGALCAARTVHPKKTDLRHKVVIGCLESREWLLGGKARDCGPSCAKATPSSYRKTLGSQQGPDGPEGKSNPGEARGLENGSPGVTGEPEI